MFNGDICWYRFAGVFYRCLVMVVFKSFIKHDVCSIVEILQGLLVGKVLSPLNNILPPKTSNQKHLPTALPILFLLSSFISLLSNQQTPFHHTGTVSGHIILHSRNTPHISNLLPSATSNNLTQRDMENSRSTPINHQIRTRDITAKPTCQETRYTSDFGGEAGAFETDGGVLRLCAKISW